MPRSSPLAIVLVLAAGCGDDTSVGDGTDGTSTTGETTSVTSPGSSTSTGGSMTDAPGSSTGGSSDTQPSSSGDSSSSVGTVGSVSSSSGDVDPQIIVHTAGPGQPVVVSAADGSLLEWSTSDDEATAVFDSDGVAMVSSLNGPQWTTISAVAPGDELWMVWRPFPDDTVLGEVTVVLPDLAQHPLPADPGFTQVAAGCIESFGGAPPAETTVTLDIRPQCVTEAGHVNIIAYAQGGPNIDVMAFSTLSEVAWTPGEEVVVTLDPWNEVLPEYVFSTTDPLANPVVNTVHTQWIEGVEFPIPRRSGFQGTRLFPVPDLAEFMKFTGSTDLGPPMSSASRMVFAQRVAYQPGGFNIPISDLLMPEITASDATLVGGRWQLSFSSPRRFSDADAVTMQTRWLGGRFWAFMAPPDATTIIVPELPAELAAEGPGEGDTLDAPFVVVVESDGYDGYDAFRGRGSYFFSGPDVLPDVDESLMRGAVYFPVPF